jgi:hypothetical protein
LAEIDKSTIHEKHSKGLVQPCGSAVPELIKSDIDDAATIVAQMGIEPWVKAMKEHPDFDIIIGGRCYDPAPYAAFCEWKGFHDLGITYHMGKIMECGALCSTPKSKEALATVRHDSFDVTPLQPKSRCTKLSVAAHTLYEKTRPDLLAGPGGTLDLHHATYEELEDGRSVRVKGAIFIPVAENEYTIKLEAGKVNGYYSMFIGGFRDEVLISQIDSFLATMRKYLETQLSFPFEVDIQLYGRDAVMGPLEPRSAEVGHELGILVRASSATQAQATQAVQTARVYCMHAAYPGQRATAGNFAMPCAPYDIPMGPVSEFCMYHLMTISDPCEYFPIKFDLIEGSNTALDRAKRASTTPVHTNGVNGNGRALNGSNERKPKAVELNGALSNGVASKSPASVLGRSPPAGHLFLADLASVVRSKNSGPYELTLDVIFGEEKNRDIVRQANILTPETFARLYNVPLDEVIVCIWWDPAIAFKATIKRPTVSGSFGDADAHGSCQHTPLMSLPIPISKKN